ncbi:MAG: prohibitin family protein [Balneolaceae bacterium]
MSILDAKPSDTDKGEDYKKWSPGWIAGQLKPRMRGVTIVFLLFLFVFIVFMERIIVYVDAGEAAVHFRRFSGGTELDRIYSEGIHFIYPWNSMAVYDVRVQKIEEEIEILSSNGLKVMVTATMRYRPFYDNLPELHQNIGPDYADRIVIPEVIAVIRQIFGQYLPEEIYASERFIIQNTVQNDIFEVSERFVELDDLLITKITLPKMIVEAIEDKLEKEQIALGYEYRILSENLEAERKRIEAGGIRDFQRIINDGITENYLRFKGIEATLQLAQSNNSKVVVIGGGRDGMPIILDGTDRGTSLINQNPVIPEYEPDNTPTDTLAQ